LGDALDEKSRHYLERIQDGARTMGGLVDDLLNLARLGKLEPRPERVPLDDVVTGVVTALDAEAGGRPIVWKLQPLPAVVCDPGTIRMVLVYVRSNAVKCTRTRDPAVIEVDHTGRAGVPLIAVRDNGVGFDTKYADKLFGAFQRLLRVEEFEG